MTFQAKPRPARDHGARDRDFLWATLPEGRTRYTRSGRGRTVLLLIHEMGGSLESFDGLLPMLEGAFDVVRYDFRGAGKSAPLRKPVSIEGLAQDACDLLDHLEVTQPALIAGVAFGAAVAIALVASAPHRARALIAINPATEIDAAAAAALRKRAARVDGEGLQAVVDRTLERSFSGLADDAHGYPLYRSRFLAQDATSYAHVLRALAALDLGDSLRQIACPVLLLSGRLDAVRPSARIEAIAAGVAGSTFEQIEGGHVAPFQAPASTAEAILRFARSLADVDKASQ